MRESKTLAQVLFHDYVNYLFIFFLRVFHVSLFYMLYLLITKTDNVSMSLQTTEEKLKERFSQKGHITDLQLKFAEDGKFRHFAFKGYLSEQEAEAALNYFNNSYFGASKIQASFFI